jgi:hypothetical protein
VQEQRHQNRSVSDAALPGFAEREITPWSSKRAGTMAETSVSQGFSRSGGVDSCYFEQVISIANTEEKPKEMIVLFGINKSKCCLSNVFSQTERLVSFNLSTSITDIP